MNIKYLDSHNGVWEHRLNNGPKPWRLLSMSDHFTDGMVVGSYYTSEQVVHLAPFVEISSGVHFEFPPKFANDERVWVDMNWLDKNGADAMQPYVGAPNRIGGVVQETGWVPGPYALVAITVRVPIEYISKR